MSDAGQAKIMARNMQERHKYDFKNQDYQPPEQKDLTPIDWNLSMDIYSMGAILFEMLCLEKLRYNRNEYNRLKNEDEDHFLRKIDKDLSNELIELCDWMTSLKREERPTAE